MDAPLPAVRVSRRGEERLRHGHLWVFGDDLREVPPGLPPGQWVTVSSRTGEFLGTATCNLILDPPSFTKPREGREGAVGGYRDINRLGLSLLAPGGILATSSCTQLIDMAKWYMVLRDAAADARADMHVLARGGQSPDPPVLLGMPETEYLKFAVLRMRGT